MDMIERPVIGSTTLLTIVISMKRTQITPLLLSHYRRQLYTIIGHTPIGVIYYIFIEKHRSIHRRYSIDDDKEKYIRIITQ